MSRKESLDRKKAAKKDTYVNMTFTSPIASCSSAGSCPPEAKPVPVEVVIPGTIECQEEEDGEEAVAIKPTVTKPKRFFSFRPLKLMQSGSFTLKNLSIDCQSNSEDKVEVSNKRFKKKANISLTHNKLLTSSLFQCPKPPSSNRLRSFFFPSSADVARKQQQDISLTNLRHVL